MKKTVEYVEGAGYVHTKVYGDDYWNKWIVARSERHAARLVEKLGWRERSSGPGGYYQHTNYNPYSKRLMICAGYDI